MVKRFLIGLCLLSVIISCTKTEYIRVDNGLVYQNKFDTIHINTDSIENKNLIKDSTFSANFYKNNKAKVEITDELKNQLLVEHNKMEDYYSKFNDGCDYYKFKANNQAQHLFYCGRINLNKKVKSLMFLYKYDMGVNISLTKILPLNKLVIYNFVKDNLCSVVDISNQLEEENISNTGLLALKFNYYLLTYNYFTTNINEHFCHYTTFYIDDIGFIRFQCFSFKDVSKFLRK
jgi:hypothetical protein